MNSPIEGEAKGGVGGGRRVLVVEDEILLAEENADILRAAGFEVVGPAYTAAAARRLIRSEAFDAAVIDVNLGGQTDSEGEQIADALSQLGVSIVFVTAYDRARLSIGFGAFSHLQKPYRPEALIRQLVANLGLAAGLSDRAASRAVA